jgi:hypothetical protein
MIFLTTNLTDHWIIISAASMATTSKAAASYGWTMTTSSSCSNTASCSSSSSASSVDRALMIVGEEADVSLEVQQLSKKFADRDWICPGTDSRYKRRVLLVEASEDVLDKFFFFKRASCYRHLFS